MDGAVAQLDVEEVPAKRLLLLLVGIGRLAREAVDDSQSLLAAKLDMDQACVEPFAASPQRPCPKVTYAGSSAATAATMASPICSPRWSR